MTDTPVMTRPDPWEKFASRDFNGEDLTRFLSSRACKLPSGSLAAGLVRMAQQAGNATGTDPFGDLAALPRTRRIDGVLPLVIPLAQSTGSLVSLLLEEIAELGHGVQDPEDPGPLGTDLAVCILAIFHGRMLAAGHGLQIALHLAPRPGNTSLVCPPGMGITGSLPLGGQITILYSSLDPAIHLDRKAAKIGPGSPLVAQRSAPGLPVFLTSPDPDDGKSG